MKRKSYKWGIIIEQVNDICYTYELVNKKFPGGKYFENKEERDIYLEKCKDVWESEGAKGFRVVTKGIFIE